MPSRTHHSLSSTFCDFDLALSINYYLDEIDTLLFLAILTFSPLNHKTFSLLLKKIMLSKELTALDPNSSIFHHFIVSSSSSTSDPINNQDFNPYGSVSPTIHSLGERISRSVNLVQADEFDIMGHENSHFMSLYGAPNYTNNSLSLSLSSQVHGIPAFHQNKQSYMAYGAEETCTSQGIGYIGGESSFVGTNDFAPVTHSSYSPSHSRYLRPAQSLLEETTNLHGNSLELSDLRRMFFSGSRGATSSELKTELLILCSSSANKHELQTKISELIALLEQAENKYDEYCNRMQEAVSSFEVIAGEESAKNYTAHALEAMCRHFSSLREAILAQIKVTMKKLCSELPHMRTGLSNLSLFDRETRQKRLNIQQLGLIQQCQRQTWRPIRGLPENSVAILRAWLFEHFLHPYPNDPEKLMLASQTGLTKNQVSNWFINARVRFWKPMIEEMYAEEFGESSSPGDSDPFFSSSCGSTREVQFDHAVYQ